MSVRKSLAAFAVAALCAGFAAPIFAQGLPWQNGQGSTGGGGWQPSAPIQSSSSSHHHHGSSGHSSSSHASHHASGNGTRAEDDRQLDVYATKFYGIHVRDTNAIGKLKKLEGQVSHWRKDLSDRGDGATDIGKDAKHLQDRIHHQRKQWEAAAAQSQPQAAAPASGQAPTPQVAPTVPLTPALSTPPAPPSPAPAMPKQ